MCSQHSKCCYSAAKYFHTHENDFNLPPATIITANSGNKWPGSRCMPHTANKQQLFLLLLLLLSKDSQLQFI